MPMWKIRVILPDDARGRDALKAALAPYPAGGPQVQEGGADPPEMTGDVVIELHDGEPIGDLLHALHEISPQVFVSRADPPSTSASALAVRRGARIHQLRRGIGVSS